MTGISDGQLLPGPRRDSSARLDHEDRGLTRWRSLGILFLTGGVLALVTLALPYDERLIPPAIAVIAVSAIAIGALLIPFGARLPDAVTPWILGLGVVMVSAAVVGSGTAASPYALFYVWAAFEAALFLQRRETVAIMLESGALYAAALAVVPGVDGSGRWLITMGTAAVVAAIGTLLRERMGALIDGLGSAARTDPLTGLVNRRGFEDVVAREADRSRRSGKPFTFVLIDLDHFKAVNDRHGHAAGDQALQRFAGLVTASARSMDTIARMGGEEFAILLPECDENAAYLLTQRLREQLSAQVGLTASFGIAAHPKHAAGPDLLLKAADQALYVAKQLGRDRAVIYNPAIAADLQTDRAQAAERAGAELSAVLLLAETLDLRDTGTAAHSRTVGRYAEAIARELDLGSVRAARIGLAGALHDIGKLGVPDAILNKPSSLDEGEWAEIRKHPEIGARILATAHLEDIGGWVVAHHERPDGTGYPRRLPSERIPLEARVLAVADAFEAMTADRPYRASMSREEARAELVAHAGRQFDARVVDAFLRALDRGGVERLVGTDADGLPPVAAG